MAVIFAWQVMFPPPLPPVEPVTAEGTVAPVPAAPATAGAAAAPPAQPAGEAVTASPRVKIETEALSGSIALTGGRLDDLHLSQYRVSLEPGADTVVLLRPADGEEPYFVDYGWLPDTGHAGPLPNSATEWRVESGDKLTRTTPVVLAWDNGQGLTFRRKFEIDDRFLFTVTQSVENASGAALTLRPYGLAARRGLPKSDGLYISHEGSVGAADGRSYAYTYEDGWMSDGMDNFEPVVAEGGRVLTVPVTESGWLGFTSKYWATAMIPLAGQPFDAVYKRVERVDLPEFRTEMRLPAVAVGAGETAQSVTHLFTGAKEFATLERYQEALGVERLDYAIDWGWFYFLTRPLFRLLQFVHGLIGNMGFSIIVLTLLVKAALFPLAYKSFVSMSKMKKLQPEMEKIKARVGDDRQKMQQEMMALYKKEKVNPAAGCLPILLQIPIFFSLYKVLYVTIEMRQAPFIGWIHDLAAPDPTTFMNLFGLLNYDIPSILAPLSIGVYPILMGVTMWMQQKLNPAPPDPTQRMIFAWMPWVFMFMLGQFASGLVIYWCANNITTFAQQYIIMRSQGLDVDLLGNITSGFKRKPEAKAEPVAAAADGDAENDADGDDAAREAEDEKPAPKSKSKPKPKPKQGASRKRGRKGN
jgi:YidC/Oxa1 family membrane protein insertase